MTAAEQNESVYRRAARQKWPKQHISIMGDGEWALFCPTTNSVRLFGFAMLAKVEMARDCSNWSCHAEHKLIKLKPVAPPKRRPLKEWGD